MSTTLAATTLAAADPTSFPSGTTGAAAHATALATTISASAFATAIATSTAPYPALDSAIAPAGSAEPDCGR